MATPPKPPRKPPRHEMNKLELIKEAINEWNGDDSKSIQTCWNIAIVMSSQEPSAEATKWIEESIKKHKRNKDKK